MNKTYLKGFGNFPFYIIKEMTKNVLLKDFNGVYHIAPIGHMIDVPDYDERPENFPTIPVVLCLTEVSDDNIHAHSGKPGIDNLAKNIDVDSFDI